VSAPRPFNLVAELTYRCPLRCPYCSNPTDYAALREGLDAADWSRVFAEAAALGVLHVGLTGGEPSTRRDLEEIVRGADAAGLYSHLVTAGLPLDAARLGELQRCGLRSVQLSVQDALAAESDRVAGTTSFERKLEIARATRALGLPLVLNVVLHRHNLARVGELIDLARELDAERLELANTQFHGWARANRAALLPRREELEEAARVVREAQRRATSARPEILFVLPDHWSDRPKPCMGGWGRKTLVVAPDGLVMPCHEARGLPGVELWNARQHSLEDCWTRAPGMNLYRGESWMPEPCRSCDQRGRDFGGCRCQAFRMTGEAAQTDPACELAPARDAMLAAREDATSAGGEEWVYRGDTTTRG
jgi:pyrroloquinoline quinone biosynthesis protein E